MKVFWLLPLSPSDLRSAAVVSVALSVTFALLLFRYWQFFQITSLGVGLAVIGAILPLTTLVAAVVQLAVTVALRFRHAPNPLSTFGGIALSILLFFALSALELRRTRAARFAAGDHRGDLAAFGQSLLPFK